MKLAVIHGPNLRLLGKREPEVYGSDSLDDVNGKLREVAIGLGVDLEIFQSNHEGEILDFIEAASGRVSGFLINPGAFTHTSIALRDALVGVDLPFVEVHLSNIFAREPVRRHSVLADLALAVIAGLGGAGYPVALATLVDRLRAG